MNKHFQELSTPKTQSVSLNEKLVKKLETTPRLTALVQAELENNQLVNIIVRSKQMNMDQKKFWQSDVNELKNQPPLEQLARKIADFLKEVCHVRDKKITREDMQKLLLSEKGYSYYSKRPSPSPI